MSSSCDVLVAYHKLIIEDDRLTEDESLNISNLMHSDITNQELALILLQGKEFTDEEIESYRKYIELINKLHAECEDNIKPLKANPNIIYVCYGQEYNYTYNSWANWLEKNIDKIEKYTDIYYGYIAHGDLSETYEKGELYDWFSIRRYFDIAQ